MVRTALTHFFALAALVVAGRAALAADPALTLRVVPERVVLVGPHDVHSVLVDGLTTAAASPADARAVAGATPSVVDLTRNAAFESSDERVAVVDARGVVRPTGDGQATVTVRAAGKAAEVLVEVRDFAQPRPIHFENDVTPILGKFTCNMSGCHGKAEGQNGFKLSVFGYDPAADYDSLVKESRGRRVQPAAPDESLLLTKASGGVPHGGGIRIRRGSEEYETLRRWIASGLPQGDPNAARVASIRLEPRERVVSMQSQQQLRVVATFTDGREADVTRHAKFQSNHDGLAVVDEAGLVTTQEAPGLVAVMASYLGAVDVFRIHIPRAEPPIESGELVANNFIDPLVWDQLRKLNVRPSEPATDAEFLRRVYLDVIGALPTPAEAKAFLLDSAPDKRAKLVDALLARPEYADYWALKWSDVLRVERQTLGREAAYAYYQWIRDGFANNRPFDAFTRELLGAEGSIADAPQGGFFKVFAKPGPTASAASQVFLGVRIACAECHHHPFDRWSQEDYAGMLGYFTQVKFKKGATGEALVAEGAPVTKHPRTGAVVFAHALGQPTPTAEPPGDRRLALAGWLTSPDNPWFARNLANRYWAHFMGRGLVEPVDDVRATNPPSNPELLDALAKYTAEKQFDVKELIRAIVASRVYQTSSRPNASNERDEQNYSRAVWKRMDAEVLEDAVCATTGVPEKFDGAPRGTRAVQLWDSQVEHGFLKLFGRPVRQTACTCERNVEASVAQVLHLLNSPEVQAKLSHAGGRVARLVRRGDDEALVEELYLAALARFPDEAERQAGVRYLTDAPLGRAKAAEDLAWSLLNSLEFVFNH